jgi:hypothetical protein
MLSLSDAEIAVRWLNAAAGKASRDRIVELLEMFRQFDSARESLKQADDVYAKLQFIQNTPRPELLAAAHEYENWIKKADAINRKINEALAHYVFRPRVTFVITEEAWRGGMFPDDNRRWFQTKVADYFTVSEADAAMSLVRLHLTGDLNRIVLCAMCKKQWRVKAKSHYRFCGKVCREEFYTKSSDYHERKAHNQREYRRKLKLMHAAQDKKRR